MKAFIYEADRLLPYAFKITDSSGLLSSLDTKSNNEYCKKEQEEPTGVVFYELAGGHNSAPNSTHIPAAVDHESNYEASVGGVSHNKHNDANGVNHFKETRLEDSGISSSNDHESSFRAVAPTKSSDETRSGYNSYGLDQFIANDTKLMHLNESKFKTMGTNQKDEPGVDHESHYEAKHDTRENIQKVAANEPVFASTDGIEEYEMGGSSFDMISTTVSSDLKPLNEGVILSASDNQQQGSKDVNLRTGNSYEVSSKDKIDTHRHSGIDQYLEEHRAIVDNRG